ncbi:hypothetical protein Q4574_13195 [Aliiglaciecola sp. 3_MG-2023]|uniref:hypothetical protein n=1 Tax=Aliiglaciecola sp. 3_MG-2023 TaxID=3062644 RepID=UPI0026E2DB07|nr:hypothetical protein [Aliiglaciecola sp. 3_MG-2023]MDO6694243.1 hypothetical protein [Aliiglaciecola sp. 3_MG-2023]
MTIHFSNCVEVWEKIFFWMPIPTILIAIFSGIMLFGQENPPNWKKHKKRVIIFELLGPLHPLVTTKYLKAEAVKYRWWFFVSVILLIFWGVGLGYAPICTQNT